MPNYNKLSYGFGHPKTHSTPLGNTANITSSSFDGIVCATTSSASPPFTDVENVACGGYNANNLNNYNQGQNNNDRS